MYAQAFGFRVYSLRALTPDIPFVAQHRFVTAGLAFERQCAENSTGLDTGIRKRFGLADFSSDQMSFLAFGRGLDTSRMRTVLGVEPRYTSTGAFEDFARSVGPAMPAAAVIGDAVSGVAGTASQAVLRSLGTGRGR